MAKFFIGERLLAIAERVYEERLPPLNADKILAPSGSGLLGAQQIERAVYQSAGRAEIVNDYGGDLPRVNVSIINDRYNVAMAGCCFGYNLKEQRAAEFSGLPLEERRGRAARRAIEEWRNDLFFVGDARAQIYGVANSSFVPRVILNEADFVEGADPDDTLKALYSLERYVNETSNNTEEPTHLLLDSVTYNYIASTRASSDGNSHETILEVYKRNAPYVKNVMAIREFNSASPSGGRMIAVLSIKPDMAEHICPDPMTFLEPQQVNLEWIVPGVCESAGFITEYPRAHAIGYIS